MELIKINPNKVEIRLMSLSEAQHTEREFLKYDSEWWLAYGGDESDGTVSTVSRNGSIDETGSNPCNPMNDFAVRPILFVDYDDMGNVPRNKAHNTFVRGSEVEFFGKKWALVIQDNSYHSAGFLLMDKPLAKMAFNDKSKDGTPAGRKYEGSDIQKFLDGWLATATTSGTSTRKNEAMKNNRQFLKKMNEEAPKRKTVSIKDLSGGAWSGAMEYFCKLYDLDCTKVFRDGDYADKLEDKIDRAGYRFDWYGRIYRDNKVIHSESLGEAKRIIPVPKWYVACYFDSKRRGLEDNLMTDDEDRAKDFAWDMANQGGYTVVKNCETGKEATIDPDEVIDDAGEYVSDKFRETEDFGESISNDGLDESLSLSKRLTEAKEDDFYFRAFITNLGKYNEGFLEGEWVDFPIEKTEFDEILKRHEIGEGEYEEWFVTDYESNLPGFSWQELGEYAGYDKLQEFGEKIDEINKSGQSKAIANAYEVTGDIQEAIDGIENGDIIFYDGISTDYDLGDVIITDVYNGEIPDELAERYFDYEGLGRDIRLEYYQEDDDMPETAGEYWCGDENASDYDIGEAFVNEVGIGDQDFHFDYEAFGRDLGFENFTFTKDGVIEMV